MSDIKMVKKTSTTSTTMTQEKRKEVPKGAKILNQTVRTETEEIENGFLISKCYDVSYEIKGSKEYAYFTRKWFSKIDPLTIKLNDQSLAEAFEQE